MIRFLSNVVAVPVAEDVVVVSAVAVAVDVAVAWVASAVAVVLSVSLGNLAGGNCNW